MKNNSQRLQPKIKDLQLFGLNPRDWRFKPQAAKEAQALQIEHKKEKGLLLEAQLKFKGPQALFKNIRLASI